MLHTAQLYTDHCIPLHWTLFTLYTKHWSMWTLHTPHLIWNTTQLNIAHLYTAKIFIEKCSLLHCSPDIEHYSPLYWSLLTSILKLVVHLYAEHTSPVHWTLLTSLLDTSRKHWSAYPLNTAHLILNATLNWSLLISTLNTVHLYIKHWSA